MLFDSNGRKLIDVVISTAWYPDYTVLEAYYDDDGSKVPDHELDQIDNTDIDLYVRGVE